MSIIGLRVATGIVRHESDKKNFVGPCGHDKNLPAECD